MHTSDQDLLLLAHRALSPLREGLALLHVRRCAKCQARFAEMGNLSSAVAAAVRPGLPVWRPMGLALPTKLILGLGAVAAALLIGQYVASLVIQSGGITATAESNGSMKTPSPAITPLKCEVHGSPLTVKKNLK